MGLRRGCWWTAAVGATVLGCVGDVSVDLESFVGGLSREPIINGTQATGYPEAALVDMNGAACSGALIAPRVVLTAGHCVQGMSTWNVTLPFARNQKARATGAAVLDYEDATEYVNPDQHDVGLVFLGAALTLDRWPVIPQAPVADGTLAIDIGRIQDGRFSSSALFQSQPIALKDARSQGFPYDYYSTEVIESGDSGGPVVSAGSSPHVIVAVNSGGGSGTEVLARTDLVYAWIDQQVKAHGGWGPSSSGGTSSSGAASSSSGAASSSSGAASSSSGASSSGGSTCSPEVEPNDSHRTATALATAACGTLSSRDSVDWYTWRIDGSTRYALDLKSSGDALVFMWKLVNGGYYRVAGTTATSIEHTATGAGTYVVLVVSFSATPQHYELTLSGGSASGGTPAGSSGGTSSGGTVADGAALYQAKCQGCHGPVATSRKRGRTAAQILARHGGMVSAAEAAAIAGAL